MKNLLTLIFASAVSAALAYNHVDPASVVWAQERSGVVSIAYTLAGAPAYVMIDVLTNGVSVGSAESAGYSGDVNGVVQPGSRSIVWRMQDEKLKRARLPEGVFSVRFNVRNANRLPDYMAVKLDDGSVAFYDSTNAVPDGVGAAQWKTTHMLFRRIPAANVSARLGLGLAERAGYNNVPAYVRTFEEDYYMALYEMTQGQYMALGNANPSSCGQTSFASLANATHRTLHETDWSWHPVDNVNYDQAMAAGTALTTRSLSGNGYGLTFTLPNEDQWEYACRSGCSQDIYTGVPATIRIAGRSTTSTSTSRRCRVTTAELRQTAIIPSIPTRSRSANSRRTTGGSTTCSATFANVARPPAAERPCCAAAVPVCPART